MKTEEKLRLLQRDLRFLEEEKKNNQELLDALHIEASFALCQQLNGIISQLQRSIDRKKEDIATLERENADGN